MTEAGPRVREVVTVKSDMGLVESFLTVAVKWPASFAVSSCVPAPMVTVAWAVSAAGFCTVATGVLDVPSETVTVGVKE